MSTFFSSSHCSSVCAQISTNSINIAKKARVITQASSPYDSTANLPTNKTRDTYIGQTVYVLYSKTPSTSFAFATTHNCTTTDLAEHYYVVESIAEGAGSINPYTITLRDRDNPSRYFTYSLNFDLEIIPIWVTISYYNYIKSQIGSKYYCLLKKFINRGPYAISNYEFCLSDHDIYTGEPIDISRTDLWELVDVSTDAKSKRIIVLFKNAKGQTTYADILDMGFIGFKHSYYLLPQKEYNRLTKKYGSYYTKMILQEKCVKGMPQELFELMMGGPYEINSSSYQDQWVYRKDGQTSYFYFSNGKLTGWN